MLIAVLILAVVSDVPPTNHEAELAKKRAIAAEYQSVARKNPSEENIFNFASSLTPLDLKSALEIYRWGVEHYSGSVRLRTGMGSVLYALGRSGDGVTVLLQAAALDPNDPHALEFIADEENVPRAQLPQVLAAFASLRKKFPNNALFLYDYAMLSSGKWSGAAHPMTSRIVQMLEHAVAIDPNLPQAQFQLGVIHEEQRQYPLAIDHYRIAARLRPHDAEYQYHLAFAYKKAGNRPAFEKELRRFQEVRRQFPHPG